MVSALYYPNNDDGSMYYIKRGKILIGALGATPPTSRRRRTASFRDLDGRPRPAHYRSRAEPRFVRAVSRRVRG